MKFVSTRGQVEQVHFSRTIQNSLAMDGGLYIPDEIPLYDMEAFQNWKGIPGLVQTAETLIEPWLDNDGLLMHLKTLCSNTFSFQAPLTMLEPGTAMLELFHGPTAAFKDFGARFLSESLTRIQPGRSKIILAATSGDTGGAVAAAFHRKPDIQVMILFPEGKVSEFQELQLTTWGDNVHAYSVRGDFDDCQRLVKKAFAHQNAKKSSSIYSANSISLGRLLPQTIYYATSSLEYFHSTGQAPGFIIPTGNLGNAVAALWAKRMGFPIREVVLAANGNRPVVNYLKTGFWEPFPTVNTVANAMDVGNPSNIERLISLYQSIRETRKDVSALSVSDSEIALEVSWAEREWNRIVCPHTATAVHARRAQKGSHWILVATAHPAKFEQVIRPWVRGKIEMPESLSQILFRKPKKVTLNPEWLELHEKISGLLGAEF